MRKIAILTLSALLLTSCLPRYDFNQATGFMAVNGLGSQKTESNHNSSNLKTYAKYANEVYKISKESDLVYTENSKVQYDADFLIHFSFIKFGKERIVTLYFLPEDEMIYILDKANEKYRESVDENQNYYLKFTEIHNEYLKTLE